MNDNKNLTIYEGGFFESIINCDNHMYYYRCKCENPDLCDFHQCCREHNILHHKVRYCFDVKSCFNRLPDNNLHFCDECCNKIKERRNKLINRKKLLIRKFNKLDKES